MTDNDIIKAFEEQLNLIGSMRGVYLDDDEGQALYDAMDDAHILINRQKAEIERLQEESKFLRKTISTNDREWLDVIDYEKAEAIEAFWNQRPPHLFVAKKGENLYNDGWNDCLAFFAEEYRIFLGALEQEDT